MTAGRTQRTGSEPDMGTAARAGQRESSYLSLAREVRKQILQGRYADGRPTTAAHASKLRLSAPVDERR